MKNTKKTELDMAKIIQGLLNLETAKKRVKHLRVLLKSILSDGEWTIKKVDAKEQDKEVKLVPKRRKGKKIVNPESYLDNSKGVTLLKHLLDDFFEGGGSVPNICKSSDTDSKFEGAVVELVFNTLGDKHGKKRQYLKLVTEFSICMDSGIHDVYIDMLLATMVETLWYTETEVFDYRVIEKTLQSFDIPLPSGITFFRKRKSKPTAKDMEILQTEDPNDFLPYPKKRKKKV